MHTLLEAVFGAGGANQVMPIAVARSATAARVANYGVAEVGLSICGGLLRGGSEADGQSCDRLGVHLIEAARISVGTLVCPVGSEDENGECRCDEQSDCDFP